MQSSTTVSAFENCPRAVRRDDIRPGLHLTNYRGRVVIAFAVEGSQVWIIGVFYAGQDYEAILQSDS